MIRDLNIAFDIFLACRYIGEDCREEIVRANAENLRRDFLPISVTQQSQRSPSVPTPTRLEDRGGKRRLFQNFLHVLFTQKLEDIR